MNKKPEAILAQMGKVIKGKDEILSKVLMAILAEGHILIEDVPGVGKTTLAVGLSKTLDLDYKRVQFTPDVLPSDIVGFSMYDKNSEEFRYMPGAVLCNLFLADEINRTSSKTQSALLEVMEEGQLTVDGVTHQLPKPFTVIATQNPSGGAGTQLLPQAQLDRFLIRISMGYPDFESQIEILRDRQNANPMDSVEHVGNREEILAMQAEVRQIHASDKILGYITRLAEATRANSLITLGLSPRGALAVCQMAKAHAYIADREYVLPQDVIDIFVDVCAHRIVLSSKAKISEKNEGQVLEDIIGQVEIENE